MSQTTAAGSDQPNADVVKAVIAAYYPRGVDAADRARDRAEKGYTIASAIAAALVAAGAFADLSKRPDVVQLLGLLALSAWLLAALLYIWAVAVPTKTGTDPTWNTPKAFVEGVSSSVLTELNKLRFRQMVAVVATIVATLLTVATLALATTDTGDKPPEKARIELTPTADNALKKLCGPKIGVVYATVDPDQLDDEIVPLRLPPGECGIAERTVRVPGAAIVAEEKDGTFPGFP